MIALIIMLLLLTFILFAIAATLGLLDDDFLWDDSQSNDIYDLLPDSLAIEPALNADLDSAEISSGTDLFSNADFDSSELIASSCLTGIDQSFNRVRARDGRSCSTGDQPLPVELTLPGFDGILNIVDGPSSNDDPPVGVTMDLPFVDAPKSNKCLPNFPYHVCCTQRGPADKSIVMPVLVYRYLLHCVMGM